MSTEPLSKKKWNYDDIPDQSGKNFIITGANSGLGLSTTKGLAAHGATVIMACRSQEKADEASDEVRKEYPDANLEIMLLDLSSFESIKQFAESFKAKYSQLHGLLNNAGIMQPPFRKTEDGLELQMGINHFGHYLLTGLLLDTIKSTPGARVVLQSSGAHALTKGINFEDINNEEKYSRTNVYAQSKLANLLFANELDRKFKSHNIDAIAVGVHPGYTATNLQSSGPAVGGSSMFSRIYKVTNLLFAQNVDKGALPLLYAAVGPDVKGGDFIGPGGFRSLRGHPKRVKAKNTAYNDEAAQKLWEISEEKTGLVYNF